VRKPKVCVGSCYSADKIWPFVICLRS